MTMEYCTAEHENTDLGCYSYPNHPGKHWAVAGDVRDSAHPDGTWIDGKWHWGEDAPGPLTFTDAELAILLMSLKGAEHFFPGLVAKLHRARAGVQ